MIPLPQSVPPAFELPDLDAPDGDLYFLLGVLFNQQIRAETAWAAPVRLADRLGGLDVYALAAFAPSALAAVMRDRPAVHPFAAVMATRVIGMCGQLATVYGARAANVWADQPSTATLLRRLTAFPGIGPHKASVAVVYLTRAYGIPLADPADQVAGQALSSCPRLREVLVT